MNNPELFEKQDYIFVEGGLEKDLCKIVSDYALLQEKTQFSNEGASGMGAQVPGSHSVYGDTLMDSLLGGVVHKLVEKNTGLELAPTYSYFRVYRRGMDLKRHMDRPSCEISTTVCFGFNYKNMPEDYRWGMYVDPETTKIPLEEREAKEMIDNHFPSPMNKGIHYGQDPGDMIIYRGQQVEHWREKFDVPAGSWQVQAFFHYIDKNGPNYPTWKWDQRKSLGIKK
jgi:hypothetical protein